MQAAPTAVAPPFRSQFNAYLRRFAWASVSGIVAGLLVIGLGGRLAMRILAITSSDAVHGAFTDAGEQINEFTLDGTIGLMIFGGAFGGLVGGWLYALIRSLLPEAKGARLRACALIGMAVGAPVFVEPGKRDFSILDPLWLAVALFVVLSAVFAIVVSLIAERWRGFYETTPLRFPRMLAFAPMILVGLVPPFLVGGLLVGVVYASLVAWAPPPQTHARAASRRRDRDWPDRRQRDPGDHRDRRPRPAPRRLRGARVLTRISVSVAR